MLLFCKENMRENISQLENKKLSWYYMRIKQQLSAIKKEIVQDLYETFKFRVEDKGKFHEAIKNIEKYISPEQKKKFKELLTTRNKLNQEIEKRQWELLKEVGFTIPNQLQCLLLKEFPWERLMQLVALIKTIKRLQEKKTTTGETINISIKLRNIMVELGIQSIEQLFIQNNDIQLPPNESLIN